MSDDFQVHSGIRRMGEWGGVVQYGPGDSSMIVMFYLKPILNPAQSEASGSPKYDDQVFVRIHPPGERLNIVDRRASDQDKKRFPIQWAQFKENAPQESSGTPIDMLYPSKPSIGASLKASGVHTVEQCAELSAHAIETIGMGCQAWVNDAQRYLQVANKGVKASELRKMSEEKDMEIHSLKHKIDLLETELNHLREQSNNAVTMQDVQQLLANQGGNGRRGVFAPGKLPKTFDAQAAQINATHATRDLANTKTAPKRSRVRMS
jgi:hypothetical protein